MTESFDILRYPHITEKAALQKEQSEGRVVVFKVNRNANKHQVKEAVIEAAQEGIIKWPSKEIRITLDVLSDLNQTRRKKASRGAKTQTERKKTGKSEAVPTQRELPRTPKPEPEQS